MAEIHYSPSLFVGRRDYTRRILSRIQDWLDGRLDTRRVLRLCGPKGSGKSWLLCETGRQIEKAFGSAVLVCHLILGEETPDGLDCSLHLPPEQTNQAPSNSINRILGHLANQMALQDLGMPTEIDRLSWWLLQRWTEDGRHIVLLVDGVDELSPPFLIELEKYVLAPWAKELRCLIVLGGRLPDPRGFVWTNLALRGPEDMDLVPFQEQESAEQLSCLAEQGWVERRQAEEVKEIQQRGGGFPLNNRILASRWPEIPPALQECADAHLDMVPHKVRDYFWALCVLKDLDDYRMAPLLAAWFGEETKDWGVPRCRQARMAMAATRLVRWDKDHGAYVMDEALRQVLEEALLANQETRWVAQHCAAYQLYCAWAGDYAEDPLWASLRDDHLARLLAQGHNPQQAP